jgi:molybdate transport system substrate-binding protein
MSEKICDHNRRAFIGTALAGSAFALAGVATARAATDVGRGRFGGEQLQVWSCGGLAEAMIPAHQLYEERSGAKITYTGAFAAALGKSLQGSATTDVFAGRVLSLAKALRESDKMDYFKPLCFTSYILVTPKGNPGGIAGIEDLANPGTCVQRTVSEVVTGKADVMIVEKRITRMAEFSGKLESIEIPAKFFPPAPLTFTVGVMKSARNRSLADDYVAFLISLEGQAYFERMGFIPAISKEGRQLVEKLGVKDV